MESNRELEREREGEGKMTWKCSLQDWEDGVRDDMRGKMTDGVRCRGFKRGGG